MPALPRLLPLALLALLALAGCRDARGDHPVPRPRVVSLTPSVTALVHHLGRAEHLVGVTRYCPRDAHMPVVGDMRPDPERVLAQRPDLVLAGEYATTTDAIASLRGGGLDVVSFPLLTVADLRAATLAIGDRLDARAPAAALVQRLDAALAAARAAAAARPGDARPPKVLLVYDVSAGHVYTTGGGDHIAALLDVLGATNAAQGGPVTARLPLEQIVRFAPDVVIHVSPTTRFPDDATARAFWSGVAGLPPATLSRVHVWPDDTLTLLGPGLPDALARLTALLAEPAPR